MLNAPVLRPATIAALSTFDVLVIRHGNTAPNPIDTQRTLTDKGREQAQAARKSYMKALPSPMASFALCSPAVRCLETARGVLGPECPELIEINSIYDALLQPGAKGVFKKLSYAPLSDYLADGPETTAVLEEYATQVLNDVGDTVAARNSAPTPGRQTLCIFGHAVYSGAIAYLLATQRGLPVSSLETILAYNMEEACAFRVGETEAQVLTHKQEEPPSKVPKTQAAEPSSASFIDKLALILVRDRKQLVARSKGKSAFFTPGRSRATRWSRMWSCGRASYGRARRR